MSASPLCFVLMPFGRKPGDGGGKIDFDAIYAEVIKVAVQKAGLDPLRADEEESGGIIHKPMFERLVLCEYAIADLTTANANVFYELGVRHAAKPRTTVLLYARGQGRLPFDVSPLRAMPYDVGPDGRPANPELLCEELAKRLELSKSRIDSDSPLYQLLDDYPNLSHEKTDVFRERVVYAEKVKSQLALTRQGSSNDIREIEVSLGALSGVEAGIVVDLFLSYRAVRAWHEMIRVHQLMNPILSRTVLVREQLGLALNRAGRGIEAERVLRALIDERGPSSETLGILGRVYKDRWEEAKRRGSTAQAEGLLRTVVDTYRKGFEADWRDAYPGVNLLTFLRILDRESADYKSLRPVVGYAVERKMASGVPDYWDYATCLELAVLDGDQSAAMKALADALGALREPWEAETTLKNVRMIREALGEGDLSLSWILELEQELVTGVQSE